MLFVVRFTDKPNTQQVRGELMDSHLAWIAENRSWVLLAGALRLAPGDAPIGGMWVVDAASREDAEDKLQLDPFWRAGIRDSVEIYLWGMAFPDMQITAASLLPS